MLTGFKNRYAFYEVINQIIMVGERDTDEKITQYIADPYYVSGHKFTLLSISVGIVLFPRDYNTNEQIMRNVDTG